MNYDLKKIPRCLQRGSLFDWILSQAQDDLEREKLQICHSGLDLESSLKDHQLIASDSGYW